jgi:phage N-6-adenine-methyltransferase
MSLVGFKARNHRQQTAKRGPNPKVDDRATTWEVFNPLHERFDFTIDVAALPHNAKLTRFFSPFDDGLSKPWAGERVWCNPPYSNIEPWVEKACIEAQRTPLIVMLLPANRTEQDWWQDWVEPSRRAGRVQVEFLRSRMRFIAHDDTEIRPNARPPYGVCLVIWETPVLEEMKP